jgi:hypothetical protein
LAALVFRGLLADTLGVLASFLGWEPLATVACALCSGGGGGGGRLGQGLAGPTVPALVSAGLALCWKRGGRLLTQLYSEATHSR